METKERLLEKIKRQENIIEKHKLEIQQGYNKIINYKRKLAILLNLE